MSYEENKPYLSEEEIKDKEAIPYYFIMFIQNNPPSTEKETSPEKLEERTKQSTS